MPLHGYFMEENRHVDGFQVLASITNVTTNIFICRSLVFLLDKFLEEEFLAQTIITYFSVWINIDKLLFGAFGPILFLLPLPADLDSIPFTMIIQGIYQMFHFANLMTPDHLRVLSVSSPSLV